MTLQLKNTSARINRRQALKFAAVGVATPFILRSGRASAADPLILCSAYGGGTLDAFDAAVFKPFTDETGIPITVVNTPDMAKLRVQIETNTVSWDLFDWVGPDLVKATRDGMLETIDPAVFEGNSMLDNAGPAMVGYGFYPGGIAYNPSLHPDHPRTWVEYWDVAKFPGKRALRTRASETLELALLADGVPAKEIYPMDVDRAFRSIEKIKPHIRKWVEQTQQTISLVYDGEVDYSYTYTNRVKTANEAGHDVALTTEENIIIGSYYVVPKGAPHRDAAMQYLAFLLRPDRLADLVERLGIIPGNRNALDKMNAAAQEVLPDLDSPNNVVVNNAWWADNIAEVGPKFKEFILT